MTSRTEARDTLLSWLDRDRDALVAFLSRFVATASPNPPGDTTAAAALLMDHLKQNGAPAEIRAAKAHLPNVVGSFAGAGAGRHLVLNGHIDVFPAGPAEQWSRDPWSGAVDGGKVHGRGVVDMKCGTAAAVSTFLYLHRLKDAIGGRLTLTCVSDEETGGTFGARWLTETWPDEFLGDCCLNGEPSTPGLIRFGEKGTLRFIVEVSTPGAHAAYTHLSKNAIRIMGQVIEALYGLEAMTFSQDGATRAAIEASKGAIDQALGAGGGDILNRITISPGVIQGGLKINMLPGDCRAEIDMRLPIGLPHAEAWPAVQAVIGRFPEAKVTPVWTHSKEPTTCDPNGPMVAILQSVVREFTGVTPVPSVSLGASDAGFWRRKGVPCYLYGCKPTNMAKPDEWVDVEEYLHIVRTHALASFDYLTA